MVYADFEYYTNVYFGTSIEEADFPRLALRASSYIDWATMGRASKHAQLDAVKLACCALAEDYQIIEAAKALANKNLSAAMSSEAGGEIQSETVGGWSRSFRSGGDSAAAAVKASASSKEFLAETAKQYLAGTGLLRARGYYA